MDRNAKRPRLLIIDDDRQLCELLTVWLSPRFEIHSAHDGEEGIDRAGKLHPELILLDVMMPKLSGFSLSWVFRHDPRYHGAAVIFISALDINSRAKAQADDHLRKPFTRSELDAVIDRVLQARRVAAPSATPVRVDEMSDGLRRAPRVNVDFPATYHVGDAVLQGTIRCLSPWGAFFATGEPVPTDRQGRVRFAAGSSAFELEGYPIYRSRHEGTDGFGLRLRTIEVEAESLLYELIEKHLPSQLAPC